MIVCVMYRNNWFGGDGWTYYPVAIEISDRCQVCDGPRGKPEGYNFHEDGEWFTVDRWTNPCGHVDLYANVLVEAGYCKKPEIPCGEPGHKHKPADFDVLLAECQ